MLVSFYILAYNQEGLIEEAITAALRQTYQPLEIIISDDCSSDGTWDVIRKVVSRYFGPHVVKLVRWDRNLGIAEHINRVWEQCSGEWIVASAGDDTSHPDRVAKIVEVARANSAVALIQTLLNETDSAGKLVYVNHLGTSATDIASRLAGRRYAEHGAAMAYRRVLFERFGRLLDGIIFEDDVLAFRAELVGEAVVLKCPLVDHRNHTGQITNSYAEVQHSERETRRKLRLTSAVCVARQKIDDLRNHDLPDPEILAGIERLLKKDLLDADLAYRAILGFWPIKLYRLFLLIKSRPVRPLLRDDFVRAIVPFAIYRIFKSGRFLFQKFVSAITGIKDTCR